MFTTTTVIELILVSIILGMIIGAFIIYELLYRKVITINDITDFLFEVEDE